MSTRPFIGARAEDGVRKVINGRLRKSGWVESVIPYTGYGTTDHVRVLARVVLRPAAATTPLGSAAEEFLSQRGWRNFFTAPAQRAQVTVTVGGSSVQVRTDRGGYVDVRLQNHDLEAGWGEATITVGEESVSAAVQVVDESVDFGIVSDIDDTILTTFLPRLFLAAWNTFVVTEEGRRAVPGMAELYRRLLDENPGSPIIYVSTGAWNTHPFLTRFLARNGYPAGPLLLTDWGPTNTGWFRSGPEHKRRALRELARDLPHIRWLLVGDDGQHDPSLYREFAELQPDKVRAIAIRQLTMAEQVLAHGTTTVLEDDDDLAWHPDLVPEVRGKDGHELAGPLEALLEEL